MRLQETFHRKPTRDFYYNYSLEHRLCICKDFVGEIFGITTDTVRVTASDKRPHQSGWKKAYVNKYVEVCFGSRTFTVLDGVEEMLKHYQLCEKPIWVRVVSLDK